MIRGLRTKTGIASFLTSRSETCRAVVRRRRRRRRRVKSQQARSLPRRRLARRTFSRRAARRSWEAGLVEAAVLPPLHPPHLLGPVAEARNLPRMARTDLRRRASGAARLPSSFQSRHRSTRQPPRVQHPRQTTARARRYAHSRKSSSLAQARRCAAILRLLRRTSARTSKVAPPRRGARSNIPHKTISITATTSTLTPTLYN